MHINQAKLDKLISDDFSIDCIEIQLTQQTHDDPIVYSGSGSIFQKNGRFHLKLYHKFNNFHKEISSPIGKVRPGKLIAEDCFFKMEATGLDGNLWISTGVSVDSGFSLPANGKIIEAPIKRLHCENETDSARETKSSSLFMVLRGNQKIPAHKREELPGGGTILNTCEFNVQGISIEIKQKENYLLINAKSENDAIDDNVQSKLVEALNIAFGRQCQVQISQLRTGNTSLSTLYSVDNEIIDKKIISPIKHDMPNNSKSLYEFIEKYMQSFQKEYDIFYGYWHKIHQSWRAGIENVALAVTTGIEGVVKNYFSDYGRPEEEILKQANEAIIAVENLDIGQKIKNRLQSNLGNVKSSNPKNALYNLASSRKIDKSLANGWVSLRNKAAHADKLDDEEGHLQKYIDEIYICHNLFFLLLLLHIGYEGEYRNLSKEGWPSVLMKPCVDPEV